MRESKCQWPETGLLKTWRRQSLIEIRLRVRTDLTTYFSMTFPWQFLNFSWHSLFLILHWRHFAENFGKWRLFRSQLNFLMVTKNMNLVKFGGKIGKNSMTLSQFFMVHDFSITILIFQVFQSLWEPWWPPLSTLFVQFAKHIYEE